MGFVIDVDGVDDVDEGEKTRGTGLPIQFNGNQSDFIRKAELIAREQIYKFFRGKKYHIGGPIPQSLLYGRQSINTVLSYSFCGGIDQIHEILGDGPSLEEQVEWSTYTLLPVLYETHRLRIHAGLRVGMIMLYLKFCKGKRIPEKDLDVTHLLT